MSRPSSSPEARGLSRLLLAALLALGLGSSAGAQEPAALLESPRSVAAAARGVRSGQEAPPGRPRVRRGRRAVLRLDRLQAALRAAEQGQARPGAVAFLLNLFDDRAWPAVLERTEADRFGHRTWVGHVEGDALSAITLTAGDGVVSGTVQFGEAIYRIEGPAADVHVEELDPASFAQELSPEGADQPTTAAGMGSAAATIPAAIVPTVDVLMLYTSDARVAQGSTAAIQAALAQGIADANTALARSGVPGLLRVAAFQEVAYAQSATSLRDDLAALAGAPAVAQMRAAAGADLVALLVERTTAGACGVSYIGPSADYAFGVTARPCLAQYTLAHELAHGLGSDHAPEDGPTGGWRPYSYGYKDPTLPSPFRTVMAYPCRTASCPRVLQFSSPRVAEARTGRVTGTPLQDNASSLAEAFPLVAAFRAQVVPLAAPAGVRAAVSGSTATIAWTPVPGASGYAIEVGTAPGASNLFSGPVGDTPAAGAVLPPGRYYARVRAVRGAEVGPPSSEVAVTVAEAPPPATLDRLDVAVDGRTVWLSWPTPAGDASGGYRLEAGYAPGASDAAVAVVAGGPVMITDAPPGTYYVRVRAVGRAGLGPPTPDAVVTVH